MDKYLPKIKKVANNIASDIYNKTPARTVVGLVKGAAQIIPEISELNDSRRRAKESASALAAASSLSASRKAAQVKYTPPRKTYEGRDTPLAPPRQFTTPQSLPKAPNYNPAPNYAASLSTKGAPSAVTPKARERAMDATKQRYSGGMDLDKRSVMQAARSRSIAAPRYK